jgi:putative membrane protein
MAAERGGTPEVKTTGAKMVQKHTELGGQLTDLAQRLGVSGAPDLSPDQRSKAARLATLSGSDFDKAFKETVDAGHVQELAMYRGEANHAIDPGLRALAQRRVTTLEQTVAQASQATKAKPKNDW